MTPSAKQLEYIRLGRHKARTDLMWLCHNILGMKKIVPHVHGPIIDFLQGFADVQGVDEYDESVGWVYTPRDPDPINVLPSKTADDHRRLILAPRGWYKTSLNIVAHSIQILLNFPDATLLITHASGETAEKMLGYIKWQFQHNKVMRFFFPEFCPSPGAKEFGTQSAFNSPARTRFTTAPSMSVAGIESIRTGMHYHWLKFTDIVDEKNSSTKDQCEKIVYSYGMARNLLIGPAYWIDIEGTRYNFSDLYGRIIDEWEEVEKEIRLAEVENRPPKSKHGFRCFTMGCYKKDVKGIKAREEYTPDELSLPYLLDAQGHEISRFPEEFPWEKLDEMRRDRVTGEQLFASQQLNNPVETDNVVFSLTDIQWKPEDDLARVPMLFYTTTVDTAETQGKRSDYTAITTVGTDRAGRKYVVDIRHGKFSTDAIIKHILEVHAKWRPVKIKIEETAFVRGLRPAIQRYAQITGVRPNFVWIQRDTQQAKVERIMSLQPWFRNRLIYFSDGLPMHVKEQIKHEISRFPKYQHDDILDTLADQFQGETMFGPQKPDVKTEDLLSRARDLMYSRLDQYNEIFGIRKEDDLPSSWTGLGAL